jgi:hypothetical protein
MIDLLALCVSCGEAIRRLLWVAEEEAIRQRLAALREETERARQAASENSPGYWRKLKSFFFGPTSERANRATPDGRTTLSTTPGDRKPRNGEPASPANRSSFDGCVYLPG